MDTSCTDGTYQVDINCLKYKVCVGNAWVTRTCPNGQIFSNGECRFAWEAQCNPGSCITGQKTAYAADCTKYNYCNENNVEVLTSCPESFWKKTQFNPSTGECDFVLWWKSCPSSSFFPLMQRRANNERERLSRVPGLHGRQMGDRQVLGKRRVQSGAQRVRVRDRSGTPSRSQLQAIPRMSVRTLGSTRLPLRRRFQPDDQNLRKNLDPAEASNPPKTPTTASPETPSVKKLEDSRGAS
ncbi:hypothetical protein GE061_008678 [Apolygus lucorum]|uniref:Chitin-binding type-2 domain-containing protein n=1 Tax=Apolygus lucorum TaxID=248454 RepID=A0A8S9WL10_APOLU|nr:hypothetical protein GE061_008678 [Apolygus lucorum]